MIGVNNQIRKLKMALSGMIFFAIAGAPPAGATEFTAGVVLKEMPAGEQASYIMGIIEGFAYARFRKDTVAAGAKDETGMKCIYDWFYKDTKAAFERIEATFTKYADQYPAVLLAAMIKKECGE